jgi:hypothetical protein
MLFMPGYIYQQAIALQNWPFAAAMSVIFLVAVQHHGEERHQVQEDLEAEAVEGGKETGHREQPQATPRPEVARDVPSLCRPRPPQLRDPPAPDGAPRREGGKETGHREQPQAWA